MRTKASGKDPIKALERWFHILELFFVRLALLLLLLFKLAQLVLTVWYGAK